jgi:Spy/CpxP family protein refolding chaperone
VKGPQAWILSAALGCFAAGMTVGFVAPGVVDALAGPGEARDPDAQYVRQLAADFGLTAEQERQLAMVVQARQQDLLELVNNNLGLLPEPLKDQVLRVRRQTTARIRHVLTPEQRARYDRESTGK